MVQSRSAAFERRHKDLDKTGRFAAAEEPVGPLAVAERKGWSGAFVVANQVVHMHYLELEMPQGLHMDFGLPLDLRPRTVDRLCLHWALKRRLPVL